MTRSIPKWLGILISKLGLLSPLDGTTELEFSSLVKSLLLAWRSSPKSIYGWTKSPKGRYSCIINIVIVDYFSTKGTKYQQPWFWFCSLENISVWAPGQLIVPWNISGAAYQARHSFITAKIFFHNYRKISNVRCIKSQNLNASRLGLQLSLCNILKPGVKTIMKM